MSSSLSLNTTGPVALMAHTVPMVPPRSCGNFFFGRTDQMSLVNTVS